MEEDNEDKVDNLKSPPEEKILTVDNTEELKSSLSDNNKPLGVDDAAKMFRRGSKLRKALLNKIVPIAYSSSFKNKDLSSSSFLHPILSQKVDRFVELIEKLIHKNR
ncbi:hypothetical protein [Rufibacter aurantiacus]|uniref:hypothetical protein n=1 Tax=Rufibacter aurantiacus TaxID=2817374 RepID=UPI001B318136|nr:hypothetical protein [Rufibacter aurantiacus]